MRLIRILCGLCACVLLAALPIAVFDIIVLNITDRFAGCRFNPEIIPAFTCGGRWFSPALDIVLNLPLLVIYAPLFTLIGPAWPNPAAMRVLYAFDIVILLGLAYPLLAIASRWKARRQS